MYNVTVEAELIEQETMFQLEICDESYSVVRLCLEVEALVWRSSALRAHVYSKKEHHLSTPKLEIEIRFEDSVKHLSILDIRTLSSSKSTSSISIEFTKKEGIDLFETFQEIRERVPHREKGCLCYRCRGTEPIPEWRFALRDLGHKLTDDDGPYADRKKDFAHSIDTHLRTEAFCAAGIWFHSGFDNRGKIQQLTKIKEQLARAAVELEKTGELLLEL